MQVETVIHKMNKKSCFDNITHMVKCVYACTNGHSEELFSPPEHLRRGGQCGLPNEEGKEREWKGQESCLAGELSSDATKTHDLVI